MQSRIIGLATLVRHAKTADGYTVLHERNSVPNAGIHGGLKLACRSHQLATKNKSLAASDKTTSRSRK